MTNGAGRGGAWRVAPSRPAVLSHLLLAVVAYGPLLVTAPGQVPADTKQYLYLDPGRLLSRAPSMWDPNVGMGTVTHQTIGYLFPMGPYYWLLERLGVPMWVAQRVWVGSILFLAGAGVLFLLRTLAPPGSSREPGRHLGPLVAALGYTLSPYTLDYVARISVILLPYAGLGWLVGLTIRGVRQGGWRHPALFALVTAAVGGVNATALLYAGVAPLLWFPFAVWVFREATPRRTLAAAARTGVLTLEVSLWWMAGLATQGAYGLPILRYSETVETVAKTSLASETLRGLGYWFFYGRDKLGPWIAASVPYTQSAWLILVSFAVPTLAFVAALALRWRYRSYFLALVVVGVTIAVGPHPYDHPSPLGALFKAAATGSTAGLAMRSTARAVPLVALGLSTLLGMGIVGLGELLGRQRTRPPAPLVAAAVLGGLVIAAIPPLWRGQFVDVNLRRPERLPRYWTEATRWLERQGTGSRVLELPGSDFAAYRWGNTIDPITPGLIDRPYVARELIPYGSPQSADLLAALDRRLQEGVLEPSALAPVARLMGVGHVVYRADLQFERYNTPRPRPTWRLLTAPVPPGLGPPVAFGTPRPNVPVRFPMLDEIALGTPAATPDPPPVSAFPVLAPLPITRAEPAGRPVLVGGDGEGMVDLAAAGLLDGRGPFFYSGSFATRPEALRALASGADLVLTDTNRRRARRWSTIRETTGYTERAGERPLRTDPRDARLDVFPGAGDDSFTVAEQRGVAAVQATDYGNAVSYTPEDRAANAFDGGPSTAWRVGAFASPVGERLVIELASDVSTDHVTLLQPISGPRNRFITRATLRFDRGAPVQVQLDERSRRPPGQLVPLGSTRTFRRLEITIDADNVGRRAGYVGLSAVGLAEVTIGSTHADEVLRLPRDLLDRLGASSAAHRLTILLTRARTAPVPPRSDEEPALARTFSLPTARSFTLGGTARLDAGIDDAAVDRLLGLEGGAAGGAGGSFITRASSSGRLPGDLRARASAALDGDPTTAWQPPIGLPVGQWLEAELPAPVTVDHLDLQVVADGRHSVPTRLRIDTESGGQARVALPDVADRPQEGAVVAVPVRFPPLTGQRFRVTVEAVRERRVLEYYSEQPTALPEAIAELGLPGAHAASASGPLPSGCRSDLLEVDGRAVAIRVTGDRPTAEALGGLGVQSCGGPLELGPGSHVVRTRPGPRTGITLDRLVLDSPPSATAGAAASSPPVSPAGDVGPGPPGTAPVVTVAHHGRTTAELQVDGARGPFWLVLGQSWSRGWTARIEGGGSLGRPEVIDGFANGWLVSPPSGHQRLVVHLDWRPQHLVRAGLAASAVGALVCILLALAAPGRRRELTLTRLRPVLVCPLAPVGARPGRVTLVLAPLAALVGGGLVAGPVVGGIAAVLVLAALLVPRGRALLAVGAVAAVALAGIDTAVAQYRFRYPPAFDWPTFFPRAHIFGWLALALLAGDGLVALVQRRRVATRRRASRAPLRRQRVRA